MKNITFLFRKLAVTSALALPVSAFGEWRLDANGNHIEVASQIYETSGLYNYAVRALNGGTVIAEDISAYGYGYAAGGVLSQGGGSSITMNGGLIETSGDSATAVQANYGGLIVLDTVSVATEGLQSYGIGLETGSRIKLNHIRVTTMGEFASGIHASQSYLDMDSSTIATSGNVAHALAIETDSTADVRSTTVSTTGNAAFGLYVASSTLNAHDSDVVTSGDSSDAIHVVQRGRVDISNAILTTSGGSAHALSIGDFGGVINVSSSTAIVHNAGSSVLNSEIFAGQVAHFNISNSVLRAEQGPSIQVSGPGHTVIEFGNTSIESAIGELFSSSSTNGSSSLVADRSILKGNIVIGSADFDGDFNLQNGSTWTGAGNGIEMLSLANSRWLMTGDSTTRNVALDGGSVLYDHDDGTYKTLTTDTLSGNGLFLMNTDLASLQGDLLVVQGVGMAKGNHLLVVSDSGQEPANGDSRLKLVNTNGGDAKFELYGGHVDAGAFRYGLQQNGDNWVLARAGGKPAEELSAGANAAVAAHSASTTLWSAEMNALVKRMGELRMGKDEGGVWTRGISKRFDFSENSSRAYTQNITGLEIGADRAIALDKGKVYLGAMVGTANAKLNFGEGASGNTDSKMVGVYATYLSDNGVYVDTVLKHSHFDNDIKMSTNLGASVKTSYKTRGVGASVEVGKHIKLGGAWFVEPQLELTGTRTQGGNYKATNGLRVKYDDVNSLQSRVGSLFGRSIELSNGIKVQPYVKASYITEHAGSSKVSVNGHKIDAELPGNRVELGFGGVVQVSENSKISLDADYAKGNSIEQPWGVNLGYRYLW